MRESKAGVRENGKCNHCHHITHQRTITTKKGKEGEKKTRF